jgi:REP element-mobilizing transposase RayT
MIRKTRANERRLRFCRAADPSNSTVLPGPRGRVLKVNRYSMYFRRMPRPLRIEFPGAWYHVANRGAGGRPVFPSGDDRNAFIELLGELEERFGVEVHAYCLMDNRYHLLVHTPKGGLGRGMRHLHGVYTQRFNRRHATDGPLFRGRYKAILVDKTNCLAPVSRYIHRIPVDTRASDSIAHYRWSSYPAYIKRVEAPDWLHTGAVLDPFKPKPRKSYRAYIKNGVDDETRAFYQSKRMSPVLGTPAFREMVREHLKSSSNDADLRAREWLRERPSITRIVDATAKVFGVEANDIYVSRRGRKSRNPPRLVAIALCRSPGGHGLRDIAKVFGVAHAASISVAANRLKVLAETDRDLAKSVTRVRDRLEKKAKKGKTESASG